MRIVYILLLVMSFGFCQDESETTGIASFLKRGLSPKWTAMSGASVALVDDATSVYWNPAGLINDIGWGFNGSYVQENRFSGVSFQQYALSFPNWKNFGVGICLSEASVKGIDQYDELANYVGSGSFQERVILMGIAYSISGLDIGFSQLYYSVNNLGESKQTILKPNKDMVVLGLRYSILKDLNVGVTIRNKAELLPNEYMESEKRIGIGYSYNYMDKQTKTDREMVNFGLDYNLVQDGGLVSIGLEVIPIDKLALRTGISDINVYTKNDNTLLAYRQKISFGLGYTFSVNNGWGLDLSISTSNHTYPSISKSFMKPLSRNTLIGFSIKF